MHESSSRASGGGGRQPQVLRARTRGSTGNDRKICSGTQDAGPISRLDHIRHEILSGTVTVARGGHGYLLSTTR